MIKQTPGNDAALDLLMLKAEMSVEGISITSNWVNLLLTVIDLTAKLYKKPGNAEHLYAICSRTWVTHRRDSQTVLV